MLGVDKLPIVYLHDPEHARFEDIMAKGVQTEVLLNFKEQGVIGHVGMAGGPVDLMTATSRPASSRPSSRTTAIRC